MKKTLKSITSLGMLTVLGVGCSPNALKSKIQSVKVETATINDVGVSLESIPAVEYQVPIDDIVFSTNSLVSAEPALAYTEMVTERKAAELTDMRRQQDARAMVEATAEATAEVGAKETADSAAIMDQKEAIRAVAVKPAIEVLPAPTLDPVGIIRNRYYYVSNKDINNALKEKMGGSYIQILELYNNAITNGKDIALIPQLNVYYQFKAKISEDKYSEEITFKLADAFSHFGAIIVASGNHYSVKWGRGRLSQVLSNAKLASGFVPPTVANIFDLSPKTEIFKSTDSNFFGFEAVSGGKIFGINFNQSRFELSALATSLPNAAADLIVAKRVSAQHVAKFGNQVKLNGRLFFYSDSRSLVSHIYFLGPDFLFKELKGQCANFAGAGLLPSGLNCSTVTTAQIGEVSNK